MTQNRRPPAYQEYAAETLSQLPFRMMSLQERGLFITMRLECWVNKQLPSDPLAISKAFGLSADEVALSLPAVMKFFKLEGEFIICPELEDYRAHLDERKLKQSQDGKTGIIITNEKRKAAKLNSMDDTTTLSSNSSTTLSSNLQVPSQGIDKSLVQLSTVQQSQVQPSKEKDSSVDSFVKDYEEYEAKQEKDSLDNGNKEYVRI